MTEEMAGWGERSELMMKSFKRNRFQLNEARKINQQIIWFIPQLDLGLKSIVFGRLPFFGDDQSQFDKEKHHLHHDEHFSGVNQCIALKNSNLKLNDQMQNEIETKSPVTRTTHKWCARKLNENPWHNGAVSSIAAPNPSRMMNSSKDVIQFIAGCRMILWKWRVIIVTPSIRWQQTVFVVAVMVTSQPKKRQLKQWRNILTVCIWWDCYLNRNRLVDWHCCGVTGWGVNTQQKLNISVILRAFAVTFDRCSRRLRCLRKQFAD